ncbi:HAD family hydrolase [Photobacterium sp. GJ3]|uniref:HAD family hydrolase n=1 Tax=Photobacterium sp. GJ3 TaxID=2829502 RepID=UPI001B8C4B64|nr:HAD family hydrolase [Photobacterium sp. GJ3]QUJ66791.1 HAD family hydrolase [Photobacterium sp. GJ3]
MKEFKKIRLIALDVDGVLLNDTYSPAIRSFVESHGGVYTAELERQVWGSPHIAGGHNMALACKLPWSAQKTIEAFFSHHAEYIKSNPIQVLPGVEDFLKMLSQYNVKVTSYGGRTKEYIFDNYMSHLRQYFDHDKPYIDTNSIRPGVDEITREIFDYNYDEVLFIDDINRMAEVAKYFNTGFIGTPVTEFQVNQMKETGTKYIVNSISEITEDMLHEIDTHLEKNTTW